MSTFLVCFNVPNKQFFSGELLVGLAEQAFNLYTMYKFKIELLYNEGKLFRTKTELLNINFTLQSAKLHIVGSRLVSNGLTFLNDIPFAIKLINFLLLSYYLILGK